jgi:hypothetical protein
MQAPVVFLTHFAVYLKKIGNFFPTANSPNFSFLVERLPTFRYHKKNYIEKSPALCLHKLFVI